MKFFYLTAALAAFYGVEATSSSVVTCSSCPPSSSVNDMVTRADITPTVSCTAAPLSIISGSMANGTEPMPTSTGGATPSEPPVSAANKMVGSATGAAALFMVMAYLS